MSAWPMKAAAVAAAALLAVSLSHIWDYSRAPDAFSRTDLLGRAPACAMTAHSTDNNRAPANGAEASPSHENGMAGPSAVEQDPPTATSDAGAGADRTEEAGSVGRTRGVEQPMREAQIRAMLDWTLDQVGDAYVLGARGPDAWDCSSLTQAALAHVGITAPHTAEAQRRWLAAGHGYRIPPGEERPGDLVFYETHLGPDVAGHVAFVYDPKMGTSLEAHSDYGGVGPFSYADGRAGLLDIWRVSRWAG